MQSFYPGLFRFRPDPARHGRLCQDRQAAGDRTSALGGAGRPWRRPATHSRFRFNVQTARGRQNAFPRHDGTRVMRRTALKESKRAQGMPGEGLTHGPPAI